MARTNTLSLEHTALRSEFSSEEWKVIQPILHEVHLNKNETLFQDKSKTEDLYFLESGKLEVSKKGHRLAVLEPGHWVGEIAALLGQVRTASVHALEKSTLLQICLHELKKATKGHPSVYNKIMTKLSQNMADRLQSSSETTIAHIEKKLAIARVRIVMAQFVCYVITGLCCFFFIVKAISEANLQPRVYAAVGTPLILFLSYFLYLLMKTSGYPLSFYGLTLKNWKKSLLESVFYSALLAGFVIGFKWVVIQTVPAYKDAPLFIFQEWISQDLHPFEWILSTVVYALFAPVQELIARGGLQGSLEKFLVGKHKTLFSIILSNLVFSTLHLQISLSIAITVFFFGCFWGWLYSRERTIIGVSLSHIFFGIWGLSILGPL